MALHLEQAGEASPIFGERFPYPLDGKMLLREVIQEFANEFNQAAKLKLNGDYGINRLRQWQDLAVTGAYPTTKQECPRIAIMRSRSTPKLAGLGGEIETRQFGDVQFRIYRGQMVSDIIEVSLCTLNERMRDDVAIWLQQYMLDAITWLLPQLPTVNDCQCVDAMDDQAEYTGNAAQPGFQFYVAKFTFRVGYELLVCEKVDALANIVNWQELG
jgi:hypothetical protein